MSFAKIKNQNVSDMINIFRQQLYEFKSDFENSNQKQRTIQNLSQKFQSFDFQMQKIESKINDAPGDEKDEYLNQYQIVKGEYLEFKQGLQKNIQNCLNGDSNKSISSKGDNNQHMLVEQSVEDQQAQDLEYMAVESQRMAKEMRELNELSHNLHIEIVDQHKKVVKIEKNTEKADENMKKGNEELKKAERNQKTCNIY